MAITAAERERRRAEIAAAALSLFIRRPSAEVPLREIAEAIGVDFFVVYRQFADRDQLYRAAVKPLVETIAAQLPGPAPAGGSVRDTIASHVRIATELLQTAAYRDLAYLRVRDGTAQPWLDGAYRDSIARPFERGLDAAVRRAGDAAGLIIGIQPGASGKLFRWLEGAIVAPALLPGAEPLSRDDFELLRQRAIARLMASTYAVDLAGTVAA